MKIDAPGLYLRMDPLRIVTAATIGEELRVFEHPLNPEQAASLGTALLATAALLRHATEVAAEQASDAEFLRKAGVIQ